MFSVGFSIQTHSTLKAKPVQFHRGSLLLITIKKKQIKCDYKKNKVYLSSKWALDLVITGYFDKTIKKFILLKSDN